MHQNGMDIASFWTLTTLAPLLGLFMNVIHSGADALFILLSVGKK